MKQDVSQRSQSIRIPNEIFWNPIKGAISLTDKRPCEGCHPTWSDLSFDNSNWVLLTAILNDFKWTFCQNETNGIQFQRQINTIPAERLCGIDKSFTGIWQTMQNIKNSQFSILIAPNEVEVDWLSLSPFVRVWFTLVVTAVVWLEMSPR